MGALAKGMSAKIGSEKSSYVIIHRLLLVREGSFEQAQRTVDVLTFDLSMDSGRQALQVGVKWSKKLGFVLLNLLGQSVVVRDCKQLCNDFGVISKELLNYDQVCLASVTSRSE